MISSADFLSISFVERENLWRLDVNEHQCSARGDLWGGVGLAAVIEAISQETQGLSPIWATAQFLKNNNTAKTLTIETESLARTNNITQYAAKGKLDEVKFMNAAACFGNTGGTQSRTTSINLTQPPQVSVPSECPEVFLGNPRSAIHQNTELRLIDGMFGVTGQGRANNQKTLVMWMRMLDVELDAGAIVILADYLLSGIGAAIGQQAAGISLDNSIRFAKKVATEWLLCEVTIQHIDAGFSYGVGHFWSEEGILMATTSQSIRVRI